MSELFERLKQGLEEADAFLHARAGDSRVHIPRDIDVKRIRTQLRMTQSAFASCFGFSVDAVRHWEAGRRVPESSARAYLTVIDSDPNAVLRVLASRRQTDGRKRPIAATATGQPPKNTSPRRAQGTAK